MILYVHMSVPNAEKKTNAVQVADKDRLVAIVYCVRTETPEFILKNWNIPPMLPPAGILKDVRELYADGSSDPMDSSSILLMRPVVFEVLDEQGWKTVDAATAQKVSEPSTIRMRIGYETGAILKSGISRIEDVTSEQIPPSMKAPEEERISELPSEFVQEDVSEAEASAESEPETGRASQLDLIVERLSRPSTEEDADGVDHGWDTLNNSPSPLHPK
jgi:hypothetical protein